MSTRSGEYWMNNDDWRSAYRLSDDFASQRFHNYNFLLRISRRLGDIATNTVIFDNIQFDAARSFDEKIRSSLRPTGKNKKQSKSLNRDADLRKIVEQSHELLLSANTVFPLTLFPDTITVDRTKVTITRRDFFWSSNVMSIRIEDVLNVTASVGPLFGSLTVASRVMSTIDHFQIDHFWRKDAKLLKCMIQGYVIAQHNRIDTAHLAKKELIDTLIELGHDTNT